MTPIIRTQRPRTILLLDTLLTCAGWLAFSYLITAGLISVANGTDHSLEFSVMGQPASTTLVLLLYLTIAAINALLLMLWGTYRKRLTRSAPQSRVPMDDVSQAERFALSGAQLEDIRLSRLLVIHHAEDGEISRWESADTSAIRLSA